MSASARMISYAQNLEDVLLWRALGRAAGGPGFYIDVGASDPTLLSVTRAFYDAGWHGLNIEPLPEAAARLRAARPRDTTIEAALGAEVGQAVPFHRVTMAAQTGLSTLYAQQAAQHAQAGAVTETLDVPVTTLAEVCRAHVRGPVHFLKIDAEGAEPDILAGADLAAVRPWIILVEAAPPGDLAPDGASDLPPPWEPILLAADYDHVWSDGLNRFYLAREHAALARHFHLPPNIFDNYTVHDPLLTQSLRDEIELSELRRDYIVQLEARISALTAVAAVPVAVDPVAADPVAADPGPVLPSIPVPSTAPSRTSSRLAWPLYALVRPIARPLAARLRRYFIGPLQQELDTHSHRLAEKLDTQNHRLAEKLEILLARPPAILATDPALLAAMQQFMLTLALQDTSDPAPPLLAPGPNEPEPPEPFQSP